MATKTALYQSIGDQLTHWEVDVEAATLTKRGSVTLPSNVQYAWPVTTAGGDVYPMLERGAIDATEWGTLWENISTGFHKVARYVIIPGVHQPTAPFELVINKEAWQKMSAVDPRKNRHMPK